MLLCVRVIFFSALCLVVQTFCPGRFSDDIWFGVCECDELTNSRRSLLRQSHGPAVENARSAPQLCASEFPKCHVLRVFLFLWSIKALSPSSSLHLFLHIPASSPSFSLPLAPTSFPAALLSFGLDCCVFPFPFFFLFFFYTFFAGISASGGSDVVVAARRVGLLTSGGRRRLLPDHRPTLQGVQREESEASGAVGDGQQTERRQAEER